MAADEATIKVTGLPLNIPENRLVDKLQIHFLRKKNGGGDIQHVSISKSTPGTAFISFQETEVARRLAQRGTQVFKVNDKNYSISISLHQCTVDPDRVLLQMSVTVDHKKLPEGKETLMALLKRFPGVFLSHNHEREPCTLTGGYTEIRALSDRILESVEMQKQSSDDEATLRSASVENHEILQEKTANQILANGGLREMKHPAEEHKSGLAQASNFNHEDFKETRSNRNPAPATPNEDLSLVVDSDIFRYLQKHCSKDYQSILNQSKVEVLNVNCEDITILYLQPKGSQSEQSLVNTAHQHLTRLFTEKALQLRKEQIPKAGIAQKDLEDSLKLLRTKLPLLMIDEDDENLYMVGSKSSVSEAKQLFVDIKGMRNRWSPSRQSAMDFTNQGAASASPSEAFQPIRSQSDDLSDLFKSRDNVQKRSKEEFYMSRRHSDVLKQVLDQTKETTTTEMFPISTSDVVTAENVLTHQTKIKSKDRDGYKSSPFDSSKSSSSASNSDLDNKPAENGLEGQKSRKVQKVKAESLKERKMAANFSSNTVDSMSLDRKIEQDQQSDSTVPAGFASAQPSYLHFIKPSMRHLCPSGFSKSDVQTLKDDMKRISQVPSNVSEKIPSVLPIPSGLPPYPKESPCYSLGYMNLSGDLSEIKREQPMALKRSNSFSGRTKGSSQKVQSNVVRSVEMGSSAMSKVVTAELMVSSRLWIYLKSVYNTHVENLTSDLQLKETLGNKNTELNLICADARKVDECLQGLKSLIAKVKVDFETRTIPLSLLGVDHKNKTLLDFCILMKQRHERVKLTIVSEFVMILGPKLTCENVEKTMMEVFHPGVHSLDSTGLPRYPVTGYPETSLFSQDLPKDLSLTGARTLNRAHPSTDARYVVIDKATQGQDNQRDSRSKMESFKTLYPGDNGAFKRESVRTLEQTECDSVIPKTKSSLNQVIPHSALEAQTAARAGGDQDVPLCSVCKRGSNTIKQPCGLNVCSQCDKDIHKTCKTCPLDPIRDPMAIKGTMSVRESTITIPGFLRNTTLRIVYDIPDGIQGEGHPCPGAPYKGGKFEAFLPDNDSTRKLCYLLEKAFHKGLTFTVKVGSTGKEEGDGQEGTVVWGSIPHKTKTEGGASKNGYPDSGYIKRLTEALKAAGIQQ